MSTSTWLWKDKLYFYKGCCTFQQNPTSAWCLEIAKNAWKTTNKRINKRTVQSLINKPKMAYSRDAFTRDQQDTRERDKRETREI